jgi:DnaJ-class molecular chaperone
MNGKDYYKVLGAEPNAESRHIKEAYRKQAYRFHPDRNEGDANALEQMKWVNEAYAVLSDPEKRRQYDAMRLQFGASAHRHFRQSYSEQDIFRNSDIHRVFEEMAKNFGVRGLDEIFREIYASGGRGFEFKRSGFYARGFVFRTPGSGGMKPGSRPNRRKAVPGGWAGWLLDKMTGHSLPKPGEDIYDSIRVSPDLARTGGPFAYEHHPRSKKLVVKIPAGVRNGQQIRLNGMGQEGRNGGPPGDLYLRVRIRTGFLSGLKRHAAAWFGGRKK